MQDIKTLVALDCGNSSFRTVLGKYSKSKGTITMEVINQTPNNMVKLGDYFYWDMLNIFQSFKNDLKEIARNEHIDSIGVCTWGVDFALMSKEGSMLSNPLSYRNTIGVDELDKLTLDEQKEMFYNTGILCDKINSIYMLSGIKKHFPTIFSASSKYLMVPDIINYFLTGEMKNEPSEFSTSQLMDARTGKLSEKVIEKFDLPKSLFCEIAKHGEKIADVKKDILEEIGVSYDIPVVCVPSHDTASAVCAIPAKEDVFGFVSCGTWSLIGSELNEPVFSDAVIDANLTNEMGAFGKITLLKNAVGMFIVNKMKSEYDFEMQKKIPWDDITSLAEECDSQCVIDLNNPKFFNPVNMSDEVWKFLCESKQVEGKKNWGILFKTFYESLACCYAHTFEDIEKVIGKKLEKIYMVGGGAKSTLLLKLTAIHSGKPVVVCFGESTSIGNVAVQIKYFEKDMSLSDVRKIISASYKTNTYTEQKLREEVLNKYRKLVLA